MVRMSGVVRCVVLGGVEVAFCVFFWVVRGAVGEARGGCRWVVYRWIWWVVRMGRDVR